MRFLYSASCLMLSDLVFALPVPSAKPDPIVTGAELIGIICASHALKHFGPDALHYISGLCRRRQPGTDQNPVAGAVDHFSPEGWAEALRNEPSLQEAVVAAATGNHPVNSGSTLNHNEILATPPNNLPFADSSTPLLIRTPSSLPSSASTSGTSIHNLASSSPGQRMTLSERFIEMLTDVATTLAWTHT